MKKYLASLVIFSSLLLSFFSSPSFAYAATFRSGENVTINTTLQDLYVTGERIVVTSPTDNDLTVAGQSISITAPVTNGILAAGETVSITSSVGNSIRTAGRSITISGPVTHDVIAFGATVTLDETASVSGDLVVAGGSVNIQAPVKGNISVYGGQVTINSTVGGNVTGNMGELILGNNAVITGNLNYSSEKRAILREGAQLKGQETFHRVERHENDKKKVVGLITQFAFYKLLTEILASLALVLLCYAFTMRVVDRGMTDVLQNGLRGFATLVLGPLLGFFLLIVLLPGVITFFLYGLLLLLAVFMSKLLVGRAILQWWYGRTNSKYVLDWKAAVVGPVVMFLLLMIPVFGWFLGFLFYLIGLGSLTGELFAGFSRPKTQTSGTKRLEKTTKKQVRTTTRTK